MNQTNASAAPHENVDDLLRSFFTREMPGSWPEANIPGAARPLYKRQTWFRSYGRLFLAASVAMILFSYLSLASMFSTESVSGLRLDRNLTIGFKSGVMKHRVPTSRGGEALLWEEMIPGDRPTIIINVQEIKGPKKR